VPQPDSKMPMPSQLPADDPSRGGSFAERTASYVWSYPLLRGALFLTVANHAAALILVLFRRLSPAMAGVVAFLSVLTWFFAVILPLMNREVRANIGGAPGGYWPQLVERFGRVVLSAQTLFHSVLLVYVAL